jgi:hypothetical protein
MENFKNIRVAKFLESCKPVNDGWTEVRKAFRFGDKVFLVTDNFPHWFASDVTEWLKGIGVETFNIEVQVSIGLINPPLPKGNKVAFQNYREFLP